MWHRSTRTKKHNSVTTKTNDDSLWKKDSLTSAQRWRNVDAVLAASLFIIWLISSTIDNKSAILKASEAYNIMMMTLHRRISISTYIMIQSQRLIMMNMYYGHEIKHTSVTVRIILLVMMNGGKSVLPMLIRLE